jgi:hypothetical protein
MQVEADETEYLLPRVCKLVRDWLGATVARPIKESLNLLPGGEEVWLGSHASQPLAGVKRERAGSAGRTLR